MRKLNSGRWNNAWKFVLRYENEVETPPDTEVKNGEAPPEENLPENKNKEKARSYSQDDVNRMLAEDRRKGQKTRQDTIDQLKSFRDSLQLTEKQKDELEVRIEQLQNETLTVQEMAKKDKEKLSKEYDKEKTKIVGERDFWRTQYSEEKIARELQDAAVDYKAISPHQITNFLKQDTKLVEELKDGKPTGHWVSRVTFHDKDDKGEPITLELSVTEAVKRMSEMEEHWNLFNSGANSGLGHFNVAGSAGASFRGKKPPKDFKDYANWRKENLKR